jgi:hypothetical protein
MRRVERIEGPTPNGGVYALAYTLPNGSIEIVEFDADHRAIHRTHGFTRDHRADPVFDPTDVKQP